MLKQKKTKLTKKFGILLSLFASVQNQETFLPFTNPRSNNLPHEDSLLPSWVPYRLAALPNGRGEGNQDSGKPSWLRERRSQARSDSRACGRRGERVQSGLDAE